MADAIVTLSGRQSFVISGAEAAVAAKNAAETAAALAGQYANANTDADIPGAPTGERGALYWTGRADAIANSNTNADVPGFAAGHRGGLFWATLARNLANSATDADITGAGAGERSALFWATFARTMSNSLTDADIPNAGAGERSARFWANQALGVLSNASFVTVSTDLNLGASSKIGIVSTNIASVNTVAGSIANVNSVAGNATNINTVAANITSINALAPQATNIGILAPYASNLAGLADTTAAIPQIGRDNQERVEADPTGNPLRWLTRDRRAVTDIAPAVAGIDTSGQRLAYVNAGDIDVIGGAGGTVTIPGTANWTGGPTLAPQLAGLVDGRSVLTVNRPFTQSRSAVMVGPTGAIVPLPDPNVAHIIMTDGQSLSHGELGRWFTSTSIWATPTLPRNVWMLKRTGALSDVRCGRSLNWIGANTTVTAAELVGLIPAGPRLWPAAGWQSTNTGETIGERFAKIYSDRLFAETGRRPFVVLVSLGLGAVSIDDMQKTGAANIPANAITKYAQDNIILTKLRDILVAQGMRGVVVAALRKHGETSAADAAYATKATQHINDRNADIRSIFGQAGNPIWLEHVHSSYGSGNNVNSVLGILSMHDAGTLHISGCDYPLLGNQGFAVTGVVTPPNWDYVHGSARGYALIGEAMADQFWQVFAFNRRRKITRLLSAVASGATITCTFDSPSGAIEAVASPGWTDPGNLGLTYTDSGGSVPTISSTSVSGATVTLTMSASVAGRAGRTVSYALNYSGTTGFSPTTKPRGMIRDPVSLGTSEVDGLPEYAWAVPARVSVTGA